MIVKVFPRPEYKGIHGRPIFNDDGSLIRWIYGILANGQHGLSNHPAVWPVEVEADRALLAGIERDACLEYEIVSNREPDGKTITVGTLANKAGKGHGPAAIIKAAAEIGITLDKKSEITVTQAEDILTQLKVK